MALPPLAELTALDILGFYQNPDVIELFLKQHRLEENLPPNEYTPGDLAWHSYILVEGTHLAKALSELSSEDVIKFWEKKTGKRKRPGPKFEPVHVHAFRYIYVSKKTRTQAYEEIVRPYLVKTNRLHLTPEGDPDPGQDLDARERFEKIIDRLTAKIRPKT